MRHLVGRVSLRCTVRGRKAAGADPGLPGRDRVDALVARCRESLPGLLQRVCDEADGSNDGHLVVDRLELDLGRVTLSGFPEKAAAALRAGLGSLTSPVERTDRKTHFFRILELYLRTGLPPWNVPDWSAGEWGGRLRELLDDPLRREALSRLLCGPDGENMKRRLRGLLAGLGEEVRDLPEGQEGKTPGREEMEGTLPDALPQKCHVRNAGLVLLGPYLEDFFRRFAVLDEDRNFASAAAGAEAVRLLDRLLHPASPEFVECDLTLAKLLCGRSLSEPLCFGNGGPAIRDDEEEKIRSFLRSVLARWEKMRGTSPEAFTQTFLIWDGVLEPGDRPVLYVEHKPYDLLLRSLPWSISAFTAPWRNQPPLLTDWN